MRFFKKSMIFVTCALSCASDHDKLLRQFSDAKKAVIFGDQIGDIASADSCKVDNWNNIQKYVCRCCIVREFDAMSDNQFDGNALLERCLSQQSACDAQSMSQLKQDEQLEGVSNNDFIQELYNRSRVIKDGSSVLKGELAKTGIFTENSLKDFLVALYNNKKLIDPAFSQVACLEVKNLAGEGGAGTGQLFRVTSSCDPKKKKNFIIKEMYGKKTEIFDLSLAAHYKPLSGYIDPQEVKDFPIIDLPIAYIYFNAGGDHYLSIMPQAKGEEFLKIMNAYVKSPDDATKKKLQKAYRALGKTLGNFHKKFMNGDSLLGKTITHGDFHARNYFYDDKSNLIYWIDNERMGKATLENRSPYTDIYYALFMPFDNDFLKFDKEVRAHPEQWFENFYTYFFDGYLQAFGGDKRERAQELKKLLMDNSSNKALVELSIRAIDTIVKKDSDVVSIEAGPLFSSSHAQKKCPDVCSKADKKWTGQWWTTVPSKMSVCQCASENL